MKNVTITLDEEVAQWARVTAAKHSSSVSRWVGELLREKMTADEGYRAAMEHFFSIEPRPLRKSPSSPYPTREELHDRAGLR